MNGAGRGKEAVGFDAQAQNASRIGIKRRQGKDRRWPGAAASRPECDQTSGSFNAAESCVTVFFMASCIERLRPAQTSLCRRHEAPLCEADFPDKLAERLAGALKTLGCIKRRALRRARMKSWEGCVCVQGAFRFIWRATLLRLPQRWTMRGCAACRRRLAIIPRPIRRPFCTACSVDTARLIAPSAAFGRSAGGKQRFRARGAGR